MPFGVWADLVGDWVWTALSCCVGREEKEGTERKLVRVIDFLIAVVVKDFSAAVWWDGQREGS